MMKNKKAELSSMKAAVLIILVTIGMVSIGMMTGVKKSGMASNPIWNNFDGRSGQYTIENNGVVKDQTGTQVATWNGNSNMKGKTYNVVSTPGKQTSATQVNPGAAAPSSGSYTTLADVPNLGNARYTVDSSGNVRASGSTDIIAKITNDQQKGKTFDVTTATVGGTQTTSLAQESTITYSSGKWTTSSGTEVNPTTGAVSSGTTLANWDSKLALSTISSSKESYKQSVKSQLTSYGVDASTAESEATSLANTYFSQGSSSGQTHAITKEIGGTYFVISNGKVSGKYKTPSEADAKTNELNAVASAASVGLTTTDYSSVSMDASGKTTYTNLYKDSSGKLYTFDGTIKNEYSKTDIIYKKDSTTTKAGTTTTSYTVYSNNNGKVGRAIGGYIVQTTSGASAKTSSLQVDTATYNEISQAAKDGALTVTSSGQNSGTITIEKGDTTTTYTLTDYQPVKNTKKQDTGVYSGSITKETEQKIYLDNKGNIISEQDYTKNEESENPIKDYKIVDNVKTSDGTTRDTTGKLTGAYDSQMSVRRGNNGEYQVYVETQKIDYKSAAGDREGVVGSINTYTVQVDGGDVLIATRDAKTNKWTTTATGEDADIVLQRASRYDSRRNYAVYEWGLTQFNGLSGYSKLIFGEDAVTEWNTKVDEFFCGEIVGWATECGWVSNICQAKIEDTPENIMVMTTESGLVLTSAYIQAEKAPSLVNENGTTEYLYKIEFMFRNDENSGYGKVRTNLFLYGDKTVKVFPTKLNASEGDTLQYTGENAIIQYSYHNYDRACLKFDKDITSADSETISTNEGICTDIEEADSTATDYSGDDDTSSDSSSDDSSSDSSSSSEDSGGTDPVDF